MSLFAPVKKKPTDFNASSQVDVSNVQLTPQQFQQSYSQVQSGTAQPTMPKATTSSLNQYGGANGTYGPFQQKTDTQQQVQKTNPFQTKPVDLSGITAITDAQKKRLTQSQQSNSDYLNNIYNLTNQSLKNQIPGLQQGFDQFKGNTEAAMADQSAATERAKVGAEERFGTAQRQGAMTRRESEGRLINKFAANNALNSYGAGSFTGSASRLEEDFNRFTQENIQTKMDQFDQLDRDLINFTREAKYLIQTEEAKLQQAISNINTQVGLNDLEKQAKLQEAYSTYEDAKSNIDLYLENLQLEQQKLGQTIAQEYTLIQQLSPEFKTTGQPTTDADMLYVQKYPDAYKAMLEGVKQAGATGQQGKVTQNVISVVDDLLNSSLGGITGILQYSQIPGTKAALSSNLYDQLKGMLSLENRQALKGSGQISDYESRVLEQAASALNRNLSEDQFRLVLQNLKDQLATGARQPLYATQDQKLQQLASILGTGNAQGSW